MADEILDRLERMASLRGSELEITLKNGNQISGELVRTKTIDKQYFLVVDQGKSNGGKIFVNFGEVSTFIPKKVPKQTEKPQYSNLPCKGKKNVENCKFPMQQFERLCSTCEHRIKKFVAPERIAPERIKKR